MNNYKYITEYTDETTIQTLKTHGALSVRTANILMWRGSYQNIGEIKNLKPEEIMMIRNAGRKAIAEIEEFQKVYKNRKAEIQEQKRLISVEFAGVLQKMR